MNYLKLYSKIIDKSINRTIEGYHELHHVKPKCMGGSNREENIVKLYPREHYICHLLLIKIYPENSKLLYAFNMMLVSSKNQNRYLPRNKQYESIRKELSKNNSINAKKYSMRPEVRKARSIAMTKRNLLDNPSKKDEVRKKLSKYKKSKEVYCENLDKHFISRADAARYFQVTPSVITTALKNNFKVKGNTIKAKE